MLPSFQLGTDTVMKLSEKNFTDLSFIDIYNQQRLSWIWSVPNFHIDKPTKIVDNLYYEKLVESIDFVQF